MNGTYCTGTEYITNTNFDADETIIDCSIQVSNVKIRNNANVTFEAANEIVINGELEVELGAELEMK